MRKVRVNEDGKMYVNDREVVVDIAENGDFSIDGKYVGQIDGNGWIYLHNRGTVGQYDITETEKEDATKLMEVRKKIISALVLSNTELIDA